MYRVLTSVFIVFLFIAGFSLTGGANAQEPASCDDVDAWIWAQSLFVSEPEAYAALDPDGNGIACEHLPVEGFGPVSWTRRIPPDAEPARLVSITDGDTFRVMVDGREDTVRMYHMNRRKCRDLTRPRNAARRARRTTFSTS